MKPTVAILSNDTIAVAFVRQIEKEPVWEYFLKALFFRASSGELTNTLEWPRPLGDLRFFALHDGGFLVRAGERLIRYSADFKVLRERKLTGAKSRGWHWLRRWEVDVAPGGRIALLSFGVVDDPVRGPHAVHTWIDVNTFEARRSFISNKLDLGVVEPAEDALAKEILQFETSHIFLSEAGREWRHFFADAGQPVFVSNDLLFVDTNVEFPIVKRKGSGFAVVNRKGEVVFEGKRSHAELAGITVRRSQQCNRFVILDSKNAIPLIQKRGYFDYRWFPKVFDISRKGMVAELSLGTLPSPWVDVALSPDGSRLAVVAGSKLKLYQLPPP